MPWECLACRTPIRSRDYASLVGRRVPYHCHVCQLELAFDKKADMLIPAEPKPDTPPMSSRKRNKR